MAQTKVNEFQALGVPGTLSTDALKSVVASKVYGTAYSAATTATGSIIVDSVPSASATITIGDIEITFVSTTPADIYEIDVTGATAAGIASAMVIAINQSPDVAAAINEGDSAEIDLTARNAGAAGNSIPVASESAAFTITAMSGGADGVSTANPKIGNAFTFNSDGDVVMGGTGAFAGILINPHNHAVYDNLNATLEIPDSSIGSLARAGYILVTMSTDASVGQAVYYAQGTGVLGAGSASGTNTAIAGAKVTRGGAAGSLVEISLIPQV